MLILSDTVQPRALAWASGILPSVDA